MDFDVQQTPWEVDGSTEAPTGGICDHGYHPKVLAAILDAVPGGNTSCDDVTDAHLAGIASLDLSREAIDSLHKRDFEGLTGLTEINLADNALDRLPGDLFEHVATLTRLQLRGNDIAALPASVFDGLTALTTLDLRDNALTGLPAGVFGRSHRPADSPAPGQRTRLAARQRVRAAHEAVEWGLLIEGNPGFEDFVPRVTVAAQTVLPRARVDLEATAGPNPWGSNLVWSWTRTDTGGETVTLEDADSRTAYFVAPAPAVETQLAFEVTATGRGTAGVASPSKAAAAVTVREASPPELSGAEVGASGDTLTLTFNEDLDIGPGKLPPGDAFTVRADGDKVAVQSVTEGGRPDNFVLRLPNNAVTEDQTVTVSYAVPESGTVIEDTVGNDALAFTYFEATNNSTVDGTPPELASAEVLGSGDRLTLTFNEDLDIGPVRLPLASAFTITADGANVPVQSVAEGGGPDHFVLRLPAAAITENQAVMVSYAVPATGTVIEDTTGNDALPFTDFAVDNNSSVDVTPPIPASAEVGHMAARSHSPSTRTSISGRSGFPRPARSPSRPTASRCRCNPWLSRQALLLTRCS